MGLLAGGLLFAAQNLCASAAAVRLARGFLPRQPLSLQALAALVVFVGFCTTSTLALGLAGALQPPAPALAAAAFALVAWRATRGPPERGAPVQPAPPDGRLLAVLSLAPLLLVAAFWLVRALAPPRLTQDDYVYHATLVAEWLSTAEIGAPRRSLGYYPANAELLSGWLALPLRHDAYVTFAGLAFGAILALAAYVVARGGDGPRWPARLAAAAVLASPVVVRAAHAFAAVDVAVAALLLAGAALASVSPAAPRREQVACLVLALLALGWAGGAKPPALLPAAVLGAFVLARAWRLLARPQRGWLALGLAVAAAPLGFWYLRNLVLTGNPVFPAAVAGLPGGAGRGATTIARFLASHPGPEAIDAMTKRLLAWPRALAIAAGAGWAWTLVALARREAAARRDLALFAAATLAVLAHPFLPFSAGNEGSFRAGAFHPTAARFLIFPFAAWIALGASRLRSGVPPRLARPIGLALSAALVFALPSLAERAPAYVEGADTAQKALAVAPPLLAAAWLARRLPAPAAVLAGAAVWLALGLAAPRQAANADAAAFARGYRGWIAREVEALPPGTTLGAVGIRSNQYPLAGRRFQHRFVPLAERALRREPDLAEALLERGLDCVVVGIDERPRKPSGAWAAAALASSPRACEIARAAAASEDHLTPVLFGLGDACEATRR